MSQNPTFHVKFPKKMDVRDKELDQTIQSLKRSFIELFGILNSNTKVLVEQTGALKHLPEMVDDLKDVMRTQFELSFLHQLQAVIHSKQADILTDQCRIDALQRFLEDKKRQLAEDHERIQERYNKLFQEVADNNLERRRQLDSHAYELVEKKWPEEVQAKFSHVSLPSFYYLAAHASECAQARTDALLESLKRTGVTIEQFLEGVQATKEQLERLMAHDRSPGVYHLPVRLLELEDEATGERRVKVVLSDLCGEIESDLLSRLEATVETLPSVPLSSSDVDALIGALENERIPTTAARAILDDSKLWSSQDSSDQ